MPSKRSRIERGGTPLTAFEKNHLLTGDCLCRPCGLCDVPPSYPGGYPLPLHWERARAAWFRHRRELSWEAPFPCLGEVLFENKPWPRRPRGLTENLGISYDLIAEALELSPPGGGE